MPMLHVQGKWYVSSESWIFEKGEHNLKAENEKNY